MELPKHLARIQPRGEREGEPVAQFEIGRMQNFVYLILDWAAKKAALVDTQHDLSAPLGCLKRYGFELTAVFVTHSHFDHTPGLPGLVRSHPELPIYLHKKELHRIDSYTLNHSKLRMIQEGDELRVGQIPVRVLHTPGHSSGECSFLLEIEPPYLFTGDTVFIRNCGRTDGESGNDEEMFQSLRRIAQLPKETIILPGHHYTPECASTVGTEIQQSPPFQCQSVAELAALP